MPANVSVRVLQPLIEYGDECRVSLRDLFAASGLGARLETDSRLPETVVARLCADAVAASGDPAFAVRAGSVAEPRSLGALGYVLQNCGSVGEALEQLQRYWSYLHDRPLFRITQNANRACLVLHADPIEEALQRQALIEYLISFMLKLSGSLVGGRERGAGYLKELRFRFPPPGEEAMQAYREVFRDVKMCFGQRETTVVFDAALLAQPVRFADTKLRAMFEAQLSDQLTAKHPNTTATSRVRALLGNKLPGSVPAISDVARELATSRAGLQRQLQAEGTSYSAILDRLRRELACDLLTGDKFSIGEIAFMLGYADRSSFHHAFQRWTGSTPQDFRATREN